MAGQLFNKLATQLLGNDICGKIFKPCCNINTCCSGTCGSGCCDNFCKKNCEGLWPFYDIWDILKNKDIQPNGRHWARVFAFSLALICPYFCFVSPGPAAELIRFFPKEAIGLARALLLAGAPMLILIAAGLTWVAWTFCTAFRGLCLSKCFWDGGSEPWKNENGWMPEYNFVNTYVCCGTLTDEKMNCIPHCVLFTTFQIVICIGAMICFPCRGPPAAVEIWTHLRWILTPFGTILLPTLAGAAGIWQSNRAIRIVELFTKPVEVVLGWLTCMATCGINGGCKCLKWCQEED